MITTIKISKEIKIQQYNKNGLKILINYNKNNGNRKEKRQIIKLDNHQVQLLEFVIKMVKNK